MFLRNSKILAILLIAIWVLVYAGAAVCQARMMHSCCQEEKPDCPILSLQDTPQVAQARPIAPDVPQALVAVSVKNDLLLKSSFSPLADFKLPQYHHLVKLGHLATAPPQA